MSCVARDFICRHRALMPAPSPEWVPVQVQVFVGIGEFIEMYNGQLHGYKIMPDVWNSTRELLLEMGPGWVIPHVYHQYEETRYMFGDDGSTWYANTSAGWMCVSQSHCAMSDLVGPVVPVTVNGTSAAAPSKRHQAGKGRPPRHHYRRPNYVQEEPAAIPLVNINEMVKPVHRKRQQGQRSRRAPTN
jgi:hypothetical protein